MVKIIVVFYTHLFVWYVSWMHYKELWIMVLIRIQYCICDPYNKSWCFTVHYIDCFIVLTEELLQHCSLLVEGWRQQFWCGAASVCVSACIYVCINIYLCSENTLMKSLPSSLNSSKYPYRTCLELM